MFFILDLDTAERYASESARTTHGSAECLDVCRLLARIICRALRGNSKLEILLGDDHLFSGAPKIVGLAQGSSEGKAEAEIRGSGYVVESLEAALWCFMRTKSFQEAVLLASNLGDDADTSAAVCGPVAGAYSGESGIPAHWLERLTLRREITALADQLYGCLMED